jgi:hypothetical protein
MKTKLFINILSAASFGLKSIKKAEVYFRFIVSLTIILGWLNSSSFLFFDTSTFTATLTLVEQLSAANTASFI